MQGHQRLISCADLCVLTANLCLYPEELKERKIKFLLTSLCFLVSRDYWKFFFLFPKEQTGSETTVNQSFVIIHVIHRQLVNSFPIQFFSHEALETLVSLKITSRHFSFFYLLVANVERRGRRGDERRRRSSCIFPRFGQQGV